MDTLDLPTPSLLVESGAFDRNVDDRVGGLLGAEIVDWVSRTCGGAARHRCLPNAG